jgi:subtilisin family serine protease
LFSLALLISQAPATGPILRVAWQEATPDSAIYPTDPYPAGQRLRHLAGLGVDRWHAAGYRGRGVKVAVLDSGFRGYRSHLGKALPAQVTVRSFRKDGNLEARDSQHGILCAEVIHALAPEAELLFANWDADSPAQFLDALRWARRQGAKVVSCSLIMPSWSDGEGGGAVNEAAAQIAGSGREAGDLLCFACAGNTAQRHWCGPFHDGGDGFHEWCPGRKDNTLRPWGHDKVSVELYWQPGANYDLYVFDATTGKEVGRSLLRLGAKRNAARGCAVVRFTPEAHHTYRVRVHGGRRTGHDKPGSFHLVVLGGGLDCSTAQGSISCPADGPAFLAVGAVDGDGRRVSYSSCGPNSCRPKPDFVAPVPFPSLWRDRPFAGTSAAAPQAAALAALWWSRYPDWTAAQVGAGLRKSARDLGPPGHDCETGYGLIRLP